MATFIRKLTSLGPGAPSVMTAIRNLGPVSYTRYRLARHRNHFLPPDATFALTSPCAQHPLICRAHTSDLDVFTQIFVEREYAPIDHIPSPALIIDCGANVGFSSAYFLSRFRQAKLIAVEPDADNYATLTANLSPYSPRVKTIRAGVWPHSCSLQVNSSALRDGHEWSRQVSESTSSNPDDTIPAIDIPTLLRESGRTRIDLLKIDIEGAESVLFSENTEAWLPSVNTLVIEIHDKPPFPDAHPIVHEAMSAHPFSVTTSGELTVFRRIKDKD